MSSVWTAVEKSTGPFIYFRVGSMDGADPVSADFMMMDSTGVMKIDAPMVRDNSNEFHYEWSSGELDIVGQYWVQLRVTMSNGRVIYGPKSWVQISIVPLVQAGAIQ